MPIPVSTSVTIGAAAGTSPPALINNGFASNVIPTDESGIVQVGSGTATTTGTLLTITLGSNYSSGIDDSGQLRPEVWPINAASAALQPYVASWTSRTIVVGVLVAPTASQAGNTYQFGYRT